MKLQLPDVTLLIADCLNANRAIKVLEHCKSLCDFGAVKLLTNIPIEYEHKVKIMPLNSLIAYSIFMLTKVHEYIDTSHVLIVQRDGWILNPETFNPSWMELDFIGPLFVQYDHVGSGGFSLRSKKLMQATAERTPQWDGRQKTADEIQKTLLYYEDGEISLSGRFKDFKIASLDDAANFAQGGNSNPKYYRPYPFGFHGVHANVNHETGFVSPVCNHPDRPACGCSLEHVNHLTSIEK